MRASKKPPATLIEHLREHAREIAAYLKRKSTAERAEARLTVDAKANASGPGGGRASIEFGMCNRYGRPPIKGNELIAEGLTMVAHEKCYRGRGGQTSTYRPQEGGDGASLNQGTSSPVTHQRRLEAMRKLGRTHVPVRMVPIDDIVRGEFDENAVRADFLPSSKSAR